MPVSIREQILAAITTAVGGEYGVPAPETERDLPITIVQDGTDTAIDDVYGQTNIEMFVAIADARPATTRDRDAIRTQANDLLAGIVQTMHVDETFGGLADGISYNGGGIQTELGKFVFAEAQFTVRFHHDRGDPYTSS